MSQPKEYFTKFDEFLIVYLMPFCIFMVFIVLGIGEIRKENMKYCHASKALSSNLNTCVCDEHALLYCK